MADWHNGYQVWLSESQSLENAQLVVNRAIKKGWNKTSICGMLGNMRTESSVNPNMYEFGYDWSADRGFGLVQWTPRHKYWDWAISNGYKESKLRDGEAQMDRIDWEAKHGEQWIAKPYNNFPESFAQFRKNSKKRGVAGATESFARCYERPLESALQQSLPERVNFAQKCYDTLDFSSSSDGGSDGGNDDGNDDDNDGGSNGGGIGDSALALIKKALTTFTDFLEDALTWDLHSIGIDKFFTNNYFQMSKTFNNTYRLKMNIPLLNEFEKLLGSITPDDNGGSDGGNDDGNDDDNNGGSKKKYNTKDFKDHYFRFRYAKTANDFPAGYPYPSANGHHGNDYDYIYETLKSHVSGTVNGNSGHGATVNDGGIGYNGDGSGWGNRIVIKLDDGSGRSVLYAHLSRMDVKAGGKIKVGQVLGQTGNTGEMTTGPHLHFELKDASNSNSASDGTIDPTPFIDKYSK